MCHNGRACVMVCVLCVHSFVSAACLACTVAYALLSCRVVASPWDTQAWWAHRVSQLWGGIWVFQCLMFACCSMTAHVRHGGPLAGIMWDEMAVSSSAVGRVWNSGCGAQQMHTSRVSI